MFRIIVNPIAGRGRTPQRLAMLLQEMDRFGLKYDVYHTTCVMDGYHKAKEICREQPDCPGIIGLGGDGTLQEIAAGMFAARQGGAFPESGKIPIPLGIFPAGSGNDFVMSLLNGKKNALARYKTDKLLAACRIFTQSLQEKFIRTVDLITANDMAYMNIGNVGLDARIVDNALALKERFGRYAYVAAVYKSIARHHNLPLTIEANGDVIKGDYTLVAICNGQYYGGGLHISPMANIEDGKITVCLVSGMTRPKTMLIFPSLMIEQHHRLKTVSYLTCDELSITLKNNESLCLDGNLYPQKPDQRIHFKMHPKMLDVFV